MKITLLAFCLGFFITLAISGCSGDPVYNDKPIVRKQGQSDLVLSIMAACQNEGVRQVSSDPNSDGEVSFYLVVCVDGTVHRVDTRGSVQVGKK